jgi:hypothetical protein
MNRISRMLFYFGGIITAATVALSAMTPAAGSAASARFAGPKANTGMVSHSIEGGRHMLTLSDDFKVPDTPDPHWQLVDSKGTVYQLDKLMLKGDRVQRKIAVPSYVSDVQKVVIWCAWAEANLGEASFGATVRTR